MNSSCIYLIIHFRFYTIASPWKCHHLSTLNNHHGIQAILSLWNWYTRKSFHRFCRATYLEPLIFLLITLHNIGFLHHIILTNPIIVNTWSVIIANLDKILRNTSSSSFVRNSRTYWPSIWRVLPLILFPGSVLLAGPKHSTSVPSSAGSEVPLSVDE